jgi:hypothetical protein
MLNFNDRLLDNSIHIHTKIEEEKEKNAIIMNHGIYEPLMEEFSDHVENLMMEIILNCSAKYIPLFWSSKRRCRRVVIVQIKLTEIYLLSRNGFSEIVLKLI